MSEAKTTPATDIPLSDPDDAVAQLQRRKTRLEASLKNATPSQKAEYTRQLKALDDSLKAARKQK